MGWLTSFPKLKMTGVIKNGQYLEKYVSEDKKECNLGSWRDITHMKFAKIKNDRYDYQEADISLMICTITEQKCTFIAAHQQRSDLQAHVERFNYVSLASPHSTIQPLDLDKTHLRLKRSEIWASLDNIATYGLDSILWETTVTER